MSDATLTKETSDIRNPRGERSCVNGVDHNGEPTKEQYVRAQWADSRITALERENAELHQVCKDWKQLHENNEGCIAGLRAELQRSHEPKMGLSSEEHQMIARLCDTSHEAVAAYERRFQIRGSLFGPIDNEMIALRDASARMIVSAINGGRKHPETSGLCPHGMPLAENICGPCSEGKPNRPASNTEGGQS